MSLDWGRELGVHSYILERLSVHLCQPALAVMVSDLQGKWSYADSALASYYHDVLHKFSKMIPK